MDRSTLAAKISWNLQQRWHFRHTAASHELSVRETVKGLQRLLLQDEGALLAQTLHRAFAQPVSWETLQRLDISLYQEGADQRVWRAQATRTDGTTRPFGLIAARAPGTSSALTQHDFTNLRTLSTRRPGTCVQPYAYGLMPLAEEVPAYTVEWLTDHRELVFEVSQHGGVFLVNAHDARRACSPQESRRIWRRLIAILWWHPDLRRVNIQAGDFVGRFLTDGGIDLRLTTARELAPHTSAATTIHAILHSVITASGYLSDGRHPFARHMPQADFVRRMQAVLHRRFGDRAAQLAQVQWGLFQRGLFARQEDWLKADCILATYDRWCAEVPAAQAWHTTCQHWTAYTQAVQAGTLSPSWWFPAGEIPGVLSKLAAQALPHPHGTSSDVIAPTQEGA